MYFVTNILFVHGLFFFNNYDSIICNSPDLLSPSMSFYFTLFLRKGLGIYALLPNCPQNNWAGGIGNLIHNQRTEKKLTK